MKKLYSFLSVGLIAALIGLSAPAHAGYYHEMLNADSMDPVAANALPAKCRLLADDLTNKKAILIDCNSVNGLSASPIAGSFTTLSATGTSTLAAINATGTFALTGAETVSSTLGVTGVTTATGGLVSVVSNDFGVPVSTGITANPIQYVTKGTCTVAAVNGGTCIPLVAATGRTISVVGYDIIATGSAATCTGILLEDTNGTPVVASTIAAAALTSGTHNFPGVANNVLGVGFGAGSGLTISKGLQIIVNGSNCTTTTSFSYQIEYSIL